MICETCEGCGQIADDGSMTPWKVWLDMPMQSTIAIQMGWVKPIDCPDCKSNKKEEIV